MKQNEILLLLGGIGILWFLKSLQSNVTVIPANEPLRVSTVAKNGVRSR